MWYITCDVTYMRIRAIVVVILTYFFINIALLDTFAKEVSYIDLRVNYDDYHYEMIYVEDGGSLTVDIETNGEITIYMVEEEEIETVYDYLRDDSKEIDCIFEDTINGNREINIKKTGSGNIILLMINHYSTDINEISGEPVMINLELITKEKPESWNMDFTLLLYIIVPILVFFIVILWIRRKA